MMKYIEKYWIVILIVFGFSMLFEPAICMLIIGSLVFYFGSISVILIRRIRRNGIECIGRIKKYQSDEEGYKTPLVEFSPFSGNTVLEQPSVYFSTDYSKLASYRDRIDEEVSLLYDPEDPTKFVLKDEEGFNNLAIALILLVSLGFIIVGTCSLLGIVRLS